jgi:hypothetical protein
VGGIQAGAGGGVANNALSSPRAGAGLGKSDESLTKSWWSSSSQRWTAGWGSKPAPKPMMASTLQPEGAYTLDEAYEAALMVSAANSRLRIARELLPRAGGTDPARARWGPRAPAGAHVAVAGRAPMAAAAALSGWQGGQGACHSCAGGTQAPVAAAAAPLGGPGGSGACHKCGELGHYKNLGAPTPGAIVQAGDRAVEAFAERGGPPGRALCVGI